MYLNKFVFILTILIVFVAGVLSGIYYKNIEISQGKTPLELYIPQPQACEYHGNTYQPGEGFPDADGCNTCSCENGQVACTLMACE